MLLLPMMDHESDDNDDDDDDCPNSALTRLPPPHTQLHGPYAGCIHFAGFKAVGESVRSPLQYYYNNVTGSLNLLAALESTTCNALVFSSSCTVYGDSANVPIKETERIEASSPYGRTKVQIEQILQDYANSGTTTKFQAIILRYFNPVGAHPSGKIGEDPKGLPNNLLPFISQVAMGYREKLNVFGTDYPTRDGTGVRDYVHVMDVARAHVLALEKMIKNPMPGKVLTYNIGTGKGTSVLEFIKAFEWASEKQVPYTLAPRRIGDVAEAYCDPSLAEKDLGFKTQLTLDDACRDAWKWQNDNPNGYRKSDEEVDGPRKALAFKIFL